MGQIGAYKLVRTPWLGAFFLLMLAVVILLLLFSEGLPKPWLMYGLPVYFAILGLRCLAFALSKYEIRDQRLYHTMPFYSREIAIDKASVFVTVPVRNVEWSNLYVCSQTKLTKIYGTENMRQFVEEVSSLGQHAASPISASCQYRIVGAPRRAVLIWGFIPFAYGSIFALGFIQNTYQNYDILLIFSSIILLMGITTLTLAAMRIRNTRVTRENEIISSYNFRGKKTGELSLRGGLKMIPISGRVCNLVVGADAVSIPYELMFNPQLMFDVFAIADGNCDFVRSGES